VGEVIPFVAVQLGRALAWAPRLPQWAADRLDRIDQQLQQLAVVHVGRGELHRQRHTLPIDEQMVFAAELATVSRVRPGVLTPALGTDAEAVQAGAAPIDRIEVAEPVQHDLVDGVPDTELLPTGAGGASR
jgi:hypothetical protein